MKQNASETFRSVKDLIIKEQLIEEKMHVIIGLSGGPDSVCLFDMLCRMAEDMQLTLHPVHVNHKFRPGDAERDQAFVENLCSRRGWPCRTDIYDCPAIAREEGLTSEEAGRKARYEAFGKTASALLESGIAAEQIVIAVAQNANDQAETILFRILRGTGTDGLSGIAVKRYEQIHPKTQISVIRPLLRTGRPEIEQYLEDRQLHACLDRTNLEPVYTRNKIRLQLLPQLAQYNENIIDALNRLGEIAQQDKSFLYGEAQKAFNQASVLPQIGTEMQAEITLRTEILEKLHPALRSRVYHIALSSIGLKENFSSTMLQEIEKVRQAKSPSAKANLADGYQVARAYEFLRFRCGESRQTDSFSTQYHLSFLSAEAYRKQCRQGKLGLHGAFCIEHFENPKKFIIRTRQDGDYISIRSGRKKIQDFFVDEKVPKEERDRIPMLAYGSEILWVLPCASFSSEKLKKTGRFCAGRKVLADTDKTIILLEISRNL